MDPLLLSHITAELRELIEGGVVSKVHQPTAREVVLKVFAKGADRRLLISAEAGCPRAHLTTSRPENPSTPPRFCAYLRSRITNARIDSIEQVAGERILRVGLRKRTDGGYEETTLICELTGKSSNIILVDSKEIVLDALKKFPADSSVRAVEPGVELRPLPPPPPPPPAPAAPATGEDTGAQPFEREEGESWNSATDRFYSARASESSFEAERARVGRVIKKAIKKARRKLANLCRDNAGAEDGLSGYRYGELLIANLYAVRRGMSEVRLVDYTVVPPAEVTVPLDAALGPKENAERFFKRARKSKRALEMLTTRVPETERDIARLEGLLREWESVEDEEGLSAISAELTEGGCELEDRTGRSPREERGGRQERGGAKAGTGAGPARRYISSEGFELLCGRSGPDNDLIVTRLAAPDDIWFHAEGVPGSHVIIRVAGRERELTRATLEEAAALAAWHSKARGAMKVEVIYSRARNVKKPRGAKPGLVTVREHKSLRVKPAEPAGGEIKGDG